MGGTGSGSYLRTSAKQTVESYCTLDINWFNKQGMLVSGLRANTTMSWTRGGSKCAEIGASSVRKRITLSYSANKTPIKYDIKVVYSECHLGGERPWFLCPCCSKRVGKLYLRDMYFYCRGCHNLSYYTRNQSEPFRLLEKSRKIRKRLGCNYGTSEPFPDKPKGMHWKTYYAMKERYWEVEGRSWRAASEFFNIG